MPKSVPMAAGPRPSRAWNTSGMTGSSMAIVPPPAMTTSAQIAIGRCVSTRRIGADVPEPRVRGATSANTIRSRTAIAATNRNGRRMPPISYSQPPMHRPDDDAERAARHREPHRAAALLRAVEIGDHREADDPGHAVGGALQQPRGKQHRQRLARRQMPAWTPRAARGRRSSGPCGRCDPRSRPSESTARAA